MNVRRADKIITAMETRDGAGVRLRRSLGQSQTARHDPFLLLDEFNSDNPDDYIAGFPSHPHRGFETVTYMLDGRMLHEDHLGNRGELKPGGVQWMTAARGIIHSEMPQQVDGLLRGFQLWINLPAKMKMNQANYRDIPPDEVPAAKLPGGGQAHVIAGVFTTDQGSTTGAVAESATDVLYVDLRLTPGEVLDCQLPPTNNAMLYVHTGDARTGPEDAEKSIHRSQAVLLASGDRLRIQAGDDGAGILLLSAEPIGEPVVQHGPFVMNTSEEIKQAMRDYRDGTLVEGRG
jgi:hypothetical protein